MFFSCLVYTVILTCHCGCRCVAQCQVRATPPRDYPTVLFIGLWPHNFHRIMYLYSIYQVFTTCCDTTLTKHTPMPTHMSHILFLIHFDNITDPGRARIWKISTLAVTSCFVYIIYTSRESRFARPLLYPCVLYIKAKSKDRG